MLYVLVEEASCDSAPLDASRAYRIVLSSRWNAGLVKSDLGSEYVLGKPGVSGEKIRWKKPFGDKIQFVRPPSQLTITLQEVRKFRYGRNIANYVINFSSDSVARPLVITPLRGSLEAAVPIRLIISISGNPVKTHKNNSAAPIEGPSNQHPATTMLHSRQFPHLVTPSSPDRPSTLRITAEAETAKGSQSLPQINPLLATQLDQLSGTGASLATAAAAGLLSTVSDLDWMVNDENLLADVHPLVKGTWSLVRSVSEIVIVQPGFDERIEDLIDAMHAGSKLAKEYAPLNGRHDPKDSVVLDILRAIIKGANIVKVYCEKRPKELSDQKTIASDLAQEVEECFHALSALKGKLGGHSGQESVVIIEHPASLIKTSADDAVLKELLYAEEANRVLRDGSPGCLIGTRTEITDAARDWATGVEPQGEQPPYLSALVLKSPILWLCGVAGAGKSSIATTVAKTLDEMDLLGSLYSFQAAKQTTLNPTNLFSTITRHLAQHDHRWEQRLIRIIHESKPNARATLSPKDQFEKFFLTLLARNNNQATVHPTVIIIDAFDECGNIGSRRELLDILTRRAREIPPGIRILVTSRYEPDVQDALTSYPKNVCLLKMEGIPKESTYRDIYAYVHKELEDVRGVDADEFVPQLAKLVTTAEESFQWASTACLFIRTEDDGDGVFGPEQRLSQVLRSKEGLDNLYRTVLDRQFGASKRETLEPLHALLGCLAYAREPLSLRSMVSLSATSPVPPSHDLRPPHRIAKKLSSLVIGTQHVEIPLVALHTSFTDFLLDEGRSKNYFVDPLEFHKRLATRSLDLMEADLQFNICEVPTSFKRNDQIKNLAKLIQDHIPDALSYACKFWAHHLSKLANWTESDALRQAVTSLLSYHFLAWLEVMSLTGSSPIGVLTDIPQITSTPLLLSDLIHEAIQFVSYFAVPITQSVAHIYLSALPFTPTSSLMYNLCAEFKATVKVVSGELIAWPNIRHILEGHTDYVLSLAFSPVGQLIASGSKDGNIRFWDAVKGLPDGILPSHSGSVTSIAFSPDGLFLVSGSDDETVCIWDMKSRTAIGKALEGHRNDINSVAFSPHGTLVASGSSDHTIRIWDVALHASAGAPLQGHRDAVASVVFSPNGSLIASGSLDHTIRIWDVKTLTTIGEPLQGHAGYVRSVAFSPDGKLIASGSDDRTVRIWDVSSRTVVGEPLKGHHDKVLSVAFSPDGRLIASGSSDQTVRLWDISSHSMIGEPLEGHGDPVMSVGFSPDGTLISSGSRDNTLRLWDIRSHSAAEKPLERHSDVVSSVVFSPDGLLIASGSYDSTIRIWDVGSCSAIGEPLEGHQDNVKSVAFSADGTLLATGLADHTIRIWNAKTWTTTGKPLTGHGSSVNSVVFSLNGLLMASGSHNGAIYIWDVELRTTVGEPLNGHSGPINSLAFSPDGTLIASGSHDKTIRVWDVESHATVGVPLEGHFAWVISVVFSLDGSLIASGSVDRAVCIWDVQSHSAVGKPLGRCTALVLSVAFSPNGNLIASGLFDKKIVIWDAYSHTAVGEPLEGHNGVVWSVAFSPDGALLASGSADGTVRIWDMRAEALTSIDYGGSLKGAPGVISTSSGDPLSSTLQQSSADLDPSLSSMQHLQDGWIIGPHGELVLWIPPSHRVGLGDSRMLAILGNPDKHNTILHFDNMVCGSDWEKCRTSDSTDRTVQY